MTNGDLETAPLPKLSSLAEVEALRRHVVDLQRNELACHVVLGLAHDINNLLHVIGSSTDLAQRQAADSTIRRDLDRIAGATERARNMLRRALDLLRRRPAGAERVSLCRIVADLQGLIVALCGSTITVTASFETSNGMIVADPLQIDQVLLNLAVNARDAMPKGGLLRLRVYDYAESATAQRDPVRFVVLEVSDTGPGIDPDLQERIFTPFFSTKAQGRGLGLAVVHAVMSHHGGRVELDHAEGRGALFRLYFRGAALEEEAADGVQSVE